MIGQRELIYLVICQAQLTESLKTIRRANLEEYKSQFMATCMATQADINGPQVRAGAPSAMAPILDESLELDSQLGIQ